MCKQVNAGMFIVKLFKRTTSSCFLCGNLNFHSKLKLSEELREFKSAKNKSKGVKRKVLEGRVMEFIPLLTWPHLCLLILLRLPGKIKIKI